MSSNIWKAAAAQCKTEVLRTVRNRRFVFFSFIMPVAFYFIFTGTVGGNTKIGGVDWSAYYLMSMTAYGVIGASINSLSIRIAKERAEGWTRLLRITPLPSWAFVASKIAAQGVINLGTVVLMFLIGGIFKGVDLTAAQWLESGLWLWIGGFAFMSLGALIGTGRSVDVVQVVSSLVFMGLSVLGGLWFPTESMSSTMQTIAKLTPTYRLGQGAWNIVGGGSIVWAGLGILCAYVAVCMLLSSYIMKKQEAV